MSTDAVIPIAIDHGFSMIKTVDEVFVTAISQIDEPFSDVNVLQFEGKYYRTSGKRIDVLEDKTSTDQFRLLTYTAIAKYLERRNVKKAHIIIGAGLPIGRLSAEKDRFKKYLITPKDVIFKYSGISYHIIIDNVIIFPQCYGAVASRIPKMKSEEVVVDIGSWTIDTLYIIDKEPNEAGCGSDANGLIPCMRRIDEQCLRHFNTKLGEPVIRDVMIDGRADIDDKYVDIIEKELTQYTKSVFISLREMGINTQTTPITFIGGGATLMKRYGGIKAKNITYIEDIKANAIGYDLLLKTYLKSKGIKARG